MKRCGCCKKSKPLSSYHKNFSSKDGHYSHCRDCRRTLDRIRRQMNRNKVIKELYDYLTENHCVDCGESNPIVLQFDHIGDNKEYNVSFLVKNGRAWSQVEKEIKKCEVVCANCHHIRTAKQQNWKMLQFMEKK